MNARLFFAIQSVVAVLVLLTCSSCPGNEATFEIYLLNLNDTFSIGALTVRNQNTQMDDVVWDEVIPPGGFERVVLPLSTYASSATVVFLSDANGGGGGTSLPIDGTPLIMIQDGSANLLIFDFKFGGESFNKILAGPLAAVAE